MVRSTEPPKQSYDIVRRNDGLVDVVIAADFREYDIGDGRKEYDIELYTLPAIRPFPDMDAHIREHFRVWAAHAEAFEREIEAIHAALDRCILDALEEYREESEEP